MRILVTGGSGQLGTDVAQAAAAKGWQVWAPDHTELDITHPVQVESAIGDYRPDWVVHCAAYTAVDRAETEEKICMAVNAAGTAYVAHACTSAGCGLLYPSTDYVFDGSGTAPHPVTERPAPLNVYGRSKLLGEQAAQAVPRHAILRISWVFGLHGNNFVKNMLRLAERRTRLSVVDDQIGCPTYTVDLARLICQMAEQNAQGVFHATGSGQPVSWYDFARRIFDLAGKEIELEPISTAAYPTAARRPLNSRPHPLAGVARRAGAVFTGIGGRKGMIQMQAQQNVGGIAGLAVLTPTVHGDDRGYFMETYNQRDMESLGFHYDFVQDNQSGSTYGVLRGLHRQLRYPQTKLVRVVSGTVFDVAVDLRPGSDTYLRWHGEVLSAENKKQFLIPAGFAHGFLVLSKRAEFCYKVTDFFHPDDEGGIPWDDPKIGVEWPIPPGMTLQLSEKDKHWEYLK